MRHVAFDTETWRIAPGRLFPRVVCLSWHDGNNGALLTRDDGIAWFRRAIADPEVVLVGANVAFDMGVMLNAAPDLATAIFDAYEAGRVLDVQIWEKLRKISMGWAKFDPRTRKPPSYNLAALVEEYLAEGMTGKHGEDVWRFRYHELDGVPLTEWPEAARDYAYEDARYTMRVWLAQQRQWDGSPDLVRQCGHDFWLTLSSAWGLRCDPDAVEQLDAELQAEIEQVYGALAKSGLVKRTKGGWKRDMKAIKAKIQQVLGDAAPTTPSGAVSTSEETLLACEDPDLTALAEVSSSAKLLSTYMPVLRQGAQVPVNPGYDVLKESGRTSSWKPNIQNLPRKGGVRECFAARPGRVFIDCDYHIAELVGLAQVLCDMYGEQSSEMASALRAGQELHLLLAADILGIGYDECVQRHKAKDKAVKEARQLAKAGNFGFPGGLGAVNFVKFSKATYGVILCGSGSEPGPTHNKDRDDEGVCLACIDAGRDLKNKWLSRFPEMRTYFSDMGDLVERAGGSAQIEQHRSGRIRGGVGYCDGCNSFFQGIVADGAKAAGWMLTKEAYTDRQSPLYRARARVVAFIHDEFMLEVDDDLHLGADSLARAAADRVSELMVQGMRLFIPSVPVKADAHLMRRWYKDAEPIFDDNGLLVPWEPDA